MAWEPELDHQSGSQFSKKCLKIELNWTEPYHSYYKECKVFYIWIKIIVIKKPLENDIRLYKENIKVFFKISNVESGMN